MEIDKTTSIIFIIIVAALVMSVVLYLDITFPEYMPIHVPFVHHEPDEQPGEPTEPVSLVRSVKKFASEAEFKDYLQEVEDYGGLSFFGVSSMAARTFDAVAAPMAMEAANGKGGAVEAYTAERVSETNVQVLGIDEPDIVKTNGREIFYSNPYSYWYGGRGGVMMETSEKIMPPNGQTREGQTKILTAFPPESLALANEMDKGGELLMKDDILAIFRDNKIYGYDVSDIEAPEQKWEMSLEDNTYVVSSRLYKGQIYLVLQKRIDTRHPCPIRPLTLNGSVLEMRCVDIYHPTQPVPVDTTYTALIINPESGEIEKKISFVGYSGSSLVYMSENSLYLTYSYYADMFTIFSRFFTQEMKDLLPADLIKKLEKLVGYDISSQAKYIEIQTLLEAYDRSLSDDERLKLENEMTNRMEDYFKRHMREMEYTGIVKISLDGFNVLANEKVPGRPLNQFSLDEYKDYLRIATTIGNRWWGFSAESANDVYVLDKKLKVAGFVRDLGLTERIYSVRFLGDRGYVVTFRQVDPFYVLDLSNPLKPEKKGELKIPGYSSYLHPVDENKVLGVGKEGSKVKLSLFDVSSAENPVEADKYTLDEYWSEALSTHHAFLMDKKHKVFFMPGSKGGYVFSYVNDKLSLKKAVSNISPRRALYLNDYLYILADNEVVVLDENTWERVKEMEF